MSDVLREVAARFGIEVDTAALDAMDDSISGLVGQLRQLGAVLAGGVAVQALRSLVDSTAQAADDLNTTAQRLQIATDSLQEWNYVAKLSDVETGEFQAAVRGLTLQLQGLSEGSEKPAEALRKLGISAKDSSGNMRTFEDLLPDIADAITELPNDTERAGLAMRLFGRSGTALLPMLKQGGDGIEKLRAEFRELGGGFSGKALEDLNEYRDQLDRTDTALESLKIEISMFVLPAFKAFADATLWVTRQLTEMWRRSYVLQTLFAGLGAALAAFAAKSLVALAPLIGSVLAVSGAIMTIVLAVDDLITTFQGGESVIQQFVDEIYGVGTTAEVIDGPITLWDDLLTAILKAAAASSEMLTGGGVRGAMDAVAQVKDRGDERTRERLEKQKEAVETGDLEGFIRSRQAAGRTTGEGLRQEFLAKRRRAIQEGRVKATEQDVAAGLADKAGGKAVAERPAPIKLDPVVFSGPRSVSTDASVRSKTVKVDAPTTVHITLPPGSDREMAERMRKLATEVFDGKLRGARAALVGDGDV